jgi:hypothetical protein
MNEDQRMFYPLVFIHPLGFLFSTKIEAKIIFCPHLSRRRVYKKCFKDEYLFIWRCLRQEDVVVADTRSYHKRMIGTHLSFLALILARAAPDVAGKFLQKKA